MVFPSYSFYISTFHLVRSSSSGMISFFSGNYALFQSYEQLFFFYQESSSREAAKDDFDDETLDINAKSAVVFVITASSFLVLLYFFMSSWFVWLLIVMFCIGGVEVMTITLHVYFDNCAKLG